MNAQLSPHHAHDAALIAARDWEPTDAQIADRAAYLLPLILKRHPEPSILVTDALATPKLSGLLDMALADGEDDTALGATLRRIVTAEAQSLAETLAEKELHRDDMGRFDASVYAALRAGDAFEWLRERSL
jgi:hypothetical protein